MRITTNNLPRFTIDAYELTPAERAEFDYLDWSSYGDPLQADWTPSKSADDATFFRYRGTLYDLGEFLACPAGMFPDGWQGYTSDSFFSGLLVRYVDDETIVVGRYSS